MAQRPVCGNYVEWDWEGVQALWSGWWDRPGVSHGAVLGLHQGAGNPSPHCGRRGQEAGPGRGGLGAWSTVARGKIRTDEVGYSVVYHLTGHYKDRNQVMILKSDFAVRGNCPLA